MIRILIRKINQHNKNNKLLLILPSLLILTILGFQQQSVFAQNLTNIEDDDSRVDTLYFSIKPLDNWAYANAAYGSVVPFFGGSDDAVEMFPNEFLNRSQVYGMFAHDGYYTYKNTKLEHYVDYKKNEPNLKGISESKLVSQQDFDINGTKTTKLTYDNPDTKHKYVLYLTEHDKEKYVGYYSAKYDFFDKYLPQFEQMLNTIRWIEGSS
jgi:hypothetical protein